MRTGERNREMYILTFSDKLLTAHIGISRDAIVSLMDDCCSNMQLWRLEAKL